MAALIAHVDARTAAQKMNIRVKLHGMRRVRARLYVVVMLLRLASWISPSPIEVSTD